MADQRVKLTSGNSLATFLSSVIEEGVKSALAQKALTEKEKQDSTANDLDSLFGGGDDTSGSEGTPEGNGDQDAPEGNATSKTMDDETEKLKKGEVEPKDVIEKLNSIRGGKSFKDEQVAKSMDEYVSSLSKPEKVALLAFLKGIAQIVTGEVQGQQAEDPGKHPADVAMEKTNDEKVKHIRPNVIKAPKKPGASGGTSNAEDTSAPVPITPKRR